MRTAIDHIYAIGDVTGKIQLAHVASAQALVAAECISGKFRKMSYDAVPSCVYTEPEIGSVGMCEADAAEKYGEDGILTGKFPMMSSGRALAVGKTAGFAKIVADKSDGRVLGCCVVGPYATEVIGEVVMAMGLGGTLTDIKEAIHAHPTVSESIAEAAHIALGEPLNSL
jgi:dihydrolipoamide dehydrogenase